MRTYVPGCRDCERTTSGNCGRHGPIVLLEADYVFEDERAEFARLTAERDKWKHEAESLKWRQRALSAKAHIEMLEAVVEAAKAVGGLTSTAVILSVSEPEVVERIDAGLKQLSVAFQRLKEGQG